MSALDPEIHAEKFDPAAGGYLVKWEKYIALKEYAREVTKALTGLTCGGSEFFGPEIDGMFTADIDRCVQHVGERHERVFYRFTDLVRRHKALKEAADELARAVSHERNMVCQDIGMQLDASSRVDAALARCREASQ